MDKIIDKLKKILALAERGEQGEAINARIMLENELRKHGLTIEDLRSELKIPRIFPYKTKEEMTLFFQILISVCGRKSEETKGSQYNSKRKQIFFVFIIYINVSTKLFHHLFSCRAIRIYHRFLSSSFNITYILIHHPSFSK